MTRYDPLQEFHDFDLIGFTHFDPEPVPPHEDMESGWTLIAATDCPLGLNQSARIPHSEHPYYFDSPDSIRYWRSSRDTVILLRGEDYGSQGANLARTDSLTRCNAIARITPEHIDSFYAGDRASAISGLDDLLTLQNAYYNGNNYAFTIVSRSGNFIDSGFGYIANEDQAVEEMKHLTRWHAARRRTAALLKGVSYLGSAACAPAATA